MIFFSGKTNVWSLLPLDWTINLPLETAHSLFCSDIVHFTDISRILSPVKVCNMLDRLYLAFDKLATTYNIFKVETIGDAWMVRCWSIVLMLEIVVLSSLT